LSDGIVGLIFRITYGRFSNRLRSNTRLANFVAHYHLSKTRFVAAVCFMRPPSLALLCFSQFGRSVAGCKNRRGARMIRSQQADGDATHGGSSVVLVFPARDMQEKSPRSNIPLKRPSAGHPSGSRTFRGLARNAFALPGRIPSRLFRNRCNR
jgi:hypothetical protein